VIFIEEHLAETKRGASGGCLRIPPNWKAGVKERKWNLTSPASGHFLFGTACGMYQINTRTGALTFLTADPEAANGDSWAVFDPNGAFVWILTAQTPCFQCQVGVDAYQVNSTGSMTLVPNPFLVMTNSEFGSFGGLAITQ
jgi:hypothetical protein